MIRATALLTLLALACLTNGCSFGMTARKYSPAQGPKGIMMHVSTGQKQLTGELIEVRADGILLVAEEKLLLLPYTAILSAEANEKDSPYIISKGTVPNRDVQEHLRLLSRFPQGLTPELIQRLLDAYGQTELAGATP